MASTTRDAAHRLDVLLTERLLRDPGAPALVEGSRRLTAGELHARATTVAHRLRMSGVGPGDRVAVRMERSMEAVIGLLAVVLAGGAHVAIDIEDPVDRVAHMLADCRPEVLLTRQRDVDALGGPAGVRVLAFEDAEQSWADDGPDRPPNAAVGSADEPVVAIYTSGSTGRPKASLISHRALTTRLASLQRTHPLGPSDRIVHHTAYGFDMFLIEVYWPLLNGCTVVIAEPGRRRDGEYLAQLIQRHSVTTLYCVVSLLEIFLVTQPPDRRFPSVRQVLTGGEPLSPSLVHTFHRQLESTLTNLYGPSECTIYCTAWQCPEDPDLDRVLIGHAIEETSLWILDAQGHPVPDGEPGELHIGGTGLALGYLNRPELTKERFLPSRFGAPDDRLYRSGDLVRSVPGGALEFLGRIDEQVKVRGYRVELGEIEVTAQRSGLVRHAAVVAHGTGNAAHLVAFVVPGTDTPRDRAEFTRLLRDEMGTMLPAYMVPAAVSLVDELPLTKNGKLDRQALVERAESVVPSTTAHVEPPGSGVETAVARIWSEVLALPAVGRHDDFFEVGGTSLKVIQVMRRLQDEFGTEIPVQLLFSRPTLSGFAALLENHLGPAADDSGPAESLAELNIR
ncbi:amino acid adenylation domain-containing protein [Streptomyces sp. NPDC056405]|uniref:non-ribosomal peptide synthetase n=1 Tax=Streptomyces sp. NPDC056405 TaxID=3345811 RepID=UPI0035D64661